ncbi:hypothetical protein [Methylobacterium sp. E-066]|uniref:hypothetical protein n=1 Tax=Methylobacterium sp. E-066 TaxID=2836584 RepID=UPI001FBA4067|nr:hypothetical protein [Methylobacterium sp. E-066]MCJ2144351.1 hypothetical protein [Methylobacterium sp. E-066]
MPIDPTRIDKEELRQLRRDIAEAHGIRLYLQYSERDAARLLIRPDERPDGSANVSTLKRKRRAGNIPHVPLGDCSVAYLGMMLCDFLAFGERSVLLWGSGDPDIIPPNPDDGSAPQS